MVVVEGQGPLYIGSTEDGLIYYSTVQDYVILILRLYTACSVEALCGSVVELAASGTSRAGRSTLPLAEYSYIASSSGTRRVELKPELLPELQEQDMSEVLGEHVCRIFLALDIEDLHFASGDLLSDVVIPNVDVFRSTILNRV